MNMSFGEALIFLKSGKTLTRENWNGKNIGVYLYIPLSRSMTNEQLSANSYIMPHFRIWDKDKKTVNSWVPSISDILENDWMILDDF